MACILSPEFTLKIQFRELSTNNATILIYTKEVVGRKEIIWRRSVIVKPILLGILLAFCLNKQNYRAIYLLSQGRGKEKCRRLHGWAAMWRKPRTPLPRVPDFIEGSNWPLHMPTGLRVVHGKWMGLVP